MNKYNYLILIWSIQWHQKFFRNLLLTMMPWKACFEMCSIKIFFPLLQVGAAPAIRATPLTYFVKQGYLWYLWKNVATSLKWYARDSGWKLQQTRVEEIRAARLCARTTTVLGRSMGWPVTWWHTASTTQDSLPFTSTSIGSGNMLTYELLCYLQEERR